MLKIEAGVEDINKVTITAKGSNVEIIINLSDVIDAVQRIIYENQLKKESQN